MDLELEQSTESRTLDPRDLVNPLYEEEIGSSAYYIDEAAMKALHIARTALLSGLMTGVFYTLMNMDPGHYINDDLELARQRIKQGLGPVKGSVFSLRPKRPQYRAFEQMSGKLVEKEPVTEEEVNKLVQDLEQPKTKEEVEKALDTYDQLKKKVPELDEIEKEITKGESNELNKTMETGLGLALGANPSKEKLKQEVSDVYRYVQELKDRQKLGFIISPPKVVPTYSQKPGEILGRPQKINPTFGSVGFG